MCLAGRYWLNREATAASPGQCLLAFRKASLETSGIVVSLVGRLLLELENMFCLLRDFLQWHVASRVVKVLRKFSKQSSQHRLSALKHWFAKEKPQHVLEPISKLNPSFVLHPNFLFTTLSATCQVDDPIHTESREVLGILWPYYYSTLLLRSLSRYRNRGQYIHNGWSKSNSAADICIDVTTPWTLSICIMPNSQSQ